jgi:hypothetical protein
MSSKSSSTRPTRAPAPRSSTLSLPAILLSLITIGIAIYYTVWDTLRAEIEARTGYHIERQFWQHGQALYNDVRAGKYEVPQEILALKARLWDSYFEQGLKWGAQWAEKGKAAYEQYQKKGEL